MIETSYEDSDSEEISQDKKGKIWKNVSYRTLREVSPISSLSSVNEALQIIN